MERTYLASTRALSVVLVVLGIVLVVSALARGGGPLALGVVIGLCLTAAGAGRLWLSSRQRSGTEP